ncbi:aldehyde dehydrogenase family protein [Microbacterium betulae]|uniref:Aldehyde dehydrogenase family protein n=1 Tax=Microbacterium betulae TaxID=2981139 RepID=A0AA97FIZ5_9MICO|nr:aldehyde dehydrogenase family protein [Microbacterium sp. AB]WOF22899.1 aldehyde dehydrogenase family protein [Microbacterium sp. AB]
MTARYAVTDPASGRTLRAYPTATDDELGTAVTAADAAYRAWRRRTVAERAGHLREAARVFRRERERLAAIATREMGKPTAQALAEVDLVAAIFAHYADRGPAVLADHRIDTSPGEAVVRTAPVGVVLGIMPWNYPYYQVARLSAPNLLLGNTVLLKPAPACPESAEAFDAVLAEAGFPAGAHTRIHATEAQIADLIARPEVQGVSLTGSERAGRAVAAAAGAAGKKVVLELGGSDPFIVLADADLDAAVEAAVFGRMQNAGQACTASKRFIVLDEVYDRFTTAFAAGVNRLTVGDPSDDVDMGPLSSEAAARRVVEQVDDALAHGARALVGGRRLERPGAFVEPTVLVDVPASARAYREEIFGPVAVVHRVHSVDEAIDLANDTPYGLGSVVFGADRGALERVIAELDVGMVAVNGPSVTQPDTPFGGVKASGIGRELGDHGLREFANHKLVRTLG